ncbi:hypothetical protein BKA64DRAFT_302810 [Cadophora sp. MPI-SDFR-AT-0126]|nr:hypothetical protein BKA64DRAFT_302810 [Leotiomycetes sp. MPI-SDFR-AT-0126]
MDRRRYFRRTPIRSAVEGNATDSETVAIVILLVEVGGNVNAAIRQAAGFVISTNLFMAASLGKETTARFLIDQGVGIDETADYPAPFQSRVSALHAAVRGDHFTIVKLLVEHGAFVNPTYYQRNKRDKEFTPRDDCYKNKGQGSETEKLLKAAGGFALHAYS